MFEVELNQCHLERFIERKKGGGFFFDRTHLETSLKSSDVLHCNVLYPLGYASDVLIECLRQSCTKGSPPEIVSRFKGVLPE